MNLFNRLRKQDERLEPSFSCLLVPSEVFMKLEEKALWSMIIVDALGWRVHNLSEEFSLLSSCSTSYMTHSESITEFCIWRNASRIHVKKSAHLRNFAHVSSVSLRIINGSMAVWLMIALSRSIAMNESPHKQWEEDNEESCEECEHSLQWNFWDDPSFSKMKLWRNLLRKLFSC